MKKRWVPNYKRKPVGLKAACRRGMGKRKDAARSLVAAAERGDAAAQLALAKACADGAPGVPQDDARAAYTDFTR